MALINNKENLKIKYEELPSENRNFIQSLLENFWKDNKDKYFDNSGKISINIKEDDLLSIFFKEFLWDVAGKIKNQDIDDNEKDFYMDWFFSEPGQIYSNNFFKNEFTKEHVRSLPKNRITDKQLSYLKKLIRTTSSKCTVCVDFEYIDKLQASKLIDFLKSLSEGKVKAIDPAIAQFIQI